MQRATRELPADAKWINGWCMRKHRKRNETVLVFAGFRAQKKPKRRLLDLLHWRFGPKSTVLFLAEFQATLLSMRLKLPIPTTPKGKPLLFHVAIMQKPPRSERPSMEMTLMTFQVMHSGRVRRILPREQGEIVAEESPELGRYNRGLECGQPQTACKNSSSPDSATKRPPPPRHLSHVPPAVKRIKREVDDSPTTRRDRQPQANHGASSEVPRIDKIDRMWVIRALGGDRRSKKFMTECNFFGRGRGCWRGAKCQFWHIQKTLGSFKLEHADEELRRQRRHPPTLDSSRVVFCQAHDDGGGVTRYTAGYQCPRTGTFYYPEHHGGWQHQKGVWWYPSRDVARQALWAVVAAACAYGSNGGR